MGGGEATIPHNTHLKVDKSQCIKIKTLALPKVYIFSRAVMLHVIAPGHAHNCLMFEEM
jgi:hypothetical protein